MPICTILFIIQPFFQYLACYKLYPEEFFWLNQIVLFLALGVANTIQWTRELTPLTENRGADRLLGLVISVLLLGLYVHIRGMLLEK